MEVACYLCTELQLKGALLKNTTALLNWTNEADVRFIHKLVQEEPEPGKDAVMSLLKMDAISWVAGVFCAFDAADLRNDPVVDTVCERNQWVKEDLQTLLRDLIEAHRQGKVYQFVFASPQNVTVACITKPAYYMQTRRDALVNTKQNTVPMVLRPVPERPCQHVLDAIRRQRKKEAAQELERLREEKKKKKQKSTVDGKPVLEHHQVTELEDEDTGVEAKDQ